MVMMNIIHIKRRSKPSKIFQWIRWRSCSVHSALITKFHARRGSTLCYQHSCALHICEKSLHKRCLNKLLTQVRWSYPEPHTKQWIFQTCETFAMGLLMLLFTQYKTTWLTAISSHCLVALLALRDVCVRQSHPAKHLLPQLEENL